jgi:putative Mg2+ transporter-C (MgtC) family protein
MTWLDEVLDTVAAEFSDVGDVAQLTRVVVRLTLAAVLGFALGFEREKQVGIVTGDMSRVIQGLVAGVGFLCAGTILKTGRDEQQVQGLTSAAGLWMTAAIGMACGLGRETTAILSTLLALAVLSLMPRVVALFERTLEPSKDVPQSPSR